MKNKLAALLFVLMVAAFPALAQETSQLLLTYGQGGALQLEGNADQVAAMNHAGTGVEMKTVQGSDSTVAVTGAAGVLNLTAKLAVNASSLTTVTAAAHSLVVTSASSTVTVNLADATTFGGDLIVVVNNNSSSAADTLTAHGSQTVAGGATLSLAAGHTAILFSDGANLQAATALVN